MERMRKCLRGFDLTGLLVEELGWNHHSGPAVPVAIEERRFHAVAVAEKKGFVVWRCESEDGRIPDHATRRRVDTRITVQAFEHMIVFMDGARREQVWHWVRREPGKPDASREYTFRAGQTGEPVLQRLQNLAFGLDEEESLTISLVADRVRGALNAEKITKRFYEHYQEELNAFQRLITGIDRSGASRCRTWFRPRWPQTRWCLTTQPLIFGVFRIRCGSKLCTRLPNRPRRWVSGPCVIGVFVSRNGLSIRGISISGW